MTLTLDTQITLIIFEGLSMVIWIIDTYDSSSIQMTCKDHRANFVSVVTPRVKRPITLLPVLCCGRCKPPDHAHINQCCVGWDIEWLLCQLLK